MPDMKELSTASVLVVQTPPQPADLTLRHVFANVLFMQTVMAPVFGSNGPLWSLANEFWYYVTFPFLLYGLIGRTAMLSRIFNGLIGLGLVLLLPTEMMLLGSIWITGAIAHYAAAKRPVG